MLKIIRILFISSSVSLLLSQTTEDLKRFMDTYDKLKVDQQANEIVKKGIESEKDPTEGPVRLLINPGDMTKYYNEKMNVIKKDLEQLNQLLISADSIPPLHHFGYNYFSLRDSIQFIDNANVSSNYILGYGDEVIICDPQNREKEMARIRFDVCIGKGRKDIFSVGQYFHTKASGQWDVIGLQITTAGDNVEAGVEGFKAQNDSESALYLQGLSDRVTEDLAEYIHQLLRHRIGTKKDYRGQRYSPGYPAITDLSYNRLIWELLEAEDIGVALTSANEFYPPSTTAAVVCFHEDAGYS